MLTLCTCAVYVCPQLPLPHPHAGGRCGSGQRAGVVRRERGGLRRHRRRWCMPPLSLHASFVPAYHPMMPGGACSPGAPRAWRGVPPHPCPRRARVLRHDGRAGRLPGGAGASCVTLSRIYSPASSVHLGRLCGSSSRPHATCLAGQPGPCQL